MILASVNGGRASWNGVVFFSDGYISEATLRNDRVDVMCKKRNTSKTKVLRVLQRVPFVRGVAIVGESLFTSKMVAILFLMMVVLNVFSLLFLPQGKVSIPYPYILVAMASILAIALLIIRFSKLSKFHGAEHMAFNAYEKGLALTVENVREMDRVSNNCGTNLIMTMFTILSVMVVLAPISPVISMVVSISIAYEIFCLSGNNPVARPFLAIGRFVQQYIVTAEPDDKQIETAILALQKLENK